MLNLLTNIPFSTIRLCLQISQFNFTICKYSREALDMVHPSVSIWPIQQDFQRTVSHVVKWTSHILPRMFCTLKRRLKSRSDNPMCVAEYCHHQLTELGLQTLGLAILHKDILVKLM